MCKDLENYSEQDWNVLLDKPELVFARARSVSMPVPLIVCVCTHASVWCFIQPHPASLNPFLPFCPRQLHQQPAGQAGHLPAPPRARRGAFMIDPIN